MQPEAYRRYRDSYQRRLFDQVIGDGEVLAATLDGEDRTRVFVPAVALMFGSALAEREEYVRATRLLTYGLERIAEDEGSRIREVGDADWFALRLIELLTLLGRYGEAWVRLPSLEEPTKPLSTRLGAIRGRAALSTIRGDYEGGHHLLNAATSVIEKIHSAFMLSTIEADRVVVLALSGRLSEATNLADRTLGPLTEPLAGPRGTWASQLGAAVALTLSRVCIEAGDVRRGERYLLMGTAAAGRAPKSYMSAQLDLAMATLWRAQGSPGTAEPVCREAAQTFARLGCRPAEAAATLELAKLAEARGMITSARPLFERAVSEMAFLGQPREHREALACLQRLDGTRQSLQLADDAAFRPPSG